MRRIRIRDLKPGMSFEQSMYLENGQKLLSPNTEITDNHLKAFLRGSSASVCLANSIQEIKEAGTVQEVDGQRVKVGQRAARQIVSDKGMVIVEQGEEIEPHHIKAMQAAGATFIGALAEDANLGDAGVLVDDEIDTKIQRRQRIIMAEALLDDLEGRLKGVDLRAKLGDGKSWFDPQDASEWPDAEDLLDYRTDMVIQLRDLFAKIEAGILVDYMAFSPIVDELMTMLFEHPYQFTQLALMCDSDIDYLPDHAFTVAVLSMAAAVNLNWSYEAIVEVSHAALLFDLGMLLVPKRIRQSADELSAEDRNRVRLHPLLSLSMLENVDDVPVIVEAATVQHHERENATGYPCMLQSRQISDYGRLLAVADMFAAAVSPRCYRTKKLPYIAMEETVRLSSANVLWGDAVRALLKATGLFPVGSCVKLSNKQTAQVISCNPKSCDRPIVQPIDELGEPIELPIDLAQIDKSMLSILRPTAHPLDI